MASKARPSRQEAAGEGRSADRKKYTMGDFLKSAYGLESLRRVAEPSARKGVGEYIVDVFISWVESSPLKRKRRGNSYFLIKEAEEMCRSSSIK